MYALAFRTGAAGVTSGLLVMVGEGLVKSVAVGRESSATELLDCTNNVIKNRVVNKKDVALVMLLPDIVAKCSYLNTAFYTQPNSMMEILIIFSFLFNFPN
jgi:hypothetical protein